MVGQAIASGLFVVAVNRIGTEDLGGSVQKPVTFYGSSFICDPYGRILVQAPRDKPAVIVAALDISARQDWLNLFPLLATRRPELYRSLTVAPSVAPPAGGDPLTTPSADGFYMPAEWQRHAQTWMLWPERPDNWRDAARPAQAAFARVAAAIAEFEPVTMCVSQSQYSAARAALPPGVRVVEMSSNDAWMRDVGPSFVVSRELSSQTPRAVRGVHWVFNAWGGLTGGLYDCWEEDARVAEVCREGVFATAGGESERSSPLVVAVLTQKVCELERIPRYAAPIVLEGGSIHVDGEGRCTRFESTASDMCTPTATTTFSLYRNVYCNRRVFTAPQSPGRRPWRPLRSRWC
jgi:hypothetical protein